MGAARTLPNHGCCTHAADPWVLHARCRTMGAARTLPNHGCCTHAAEPCVLHARCGTMGAARMLPQDSAFLYARCHRLPTSAAASVGSCLGWDLLPTPFHTCLIPREFDLERDLFVHTFPHIFHTRPRISTPSAAPGDLFELQTRAREAAAFAAPKGVLGPLAVADRHKPHEGGAHQDGRVAGGQR
eukprot:365077-Chlamydomonas_euryale.AAC.21